MAMAGGAKVDVCAFGALVLKQRAVEVHSFTLSTLDTFGLSGLGYRMSYNANASPETVRRLDCISLERNYRIGVVLLNLKP